MDDKKGFFEEIFEGLIQGLFVIPLFSLIFYIIVSYPIPILISTFYVVLYFLLKKRLKKVRGC